MVMPRTLYKPAKTDAFSRLHWVSVYRSEIYVSNVSIDILNTYLLHMFGTNSLKKSSVLAS